MIQHTRLPALTDEFKRRARNSGHNTTALGLSWDFSFPTVFFLNPNNVKLENVGSSDNEIGNRSNLALGGPLGFEIIGLNRWDLWGEIGAAVSDEAGGAVLNSGRPVHHLVGGVAHGRIPRVLQREEEGNYVVLEARDLEVLKKWGLKPFLSSGIWRDGILLKTKRKRYWPVLSRIAVQLSSI